jgi:AraC-like DNA-binding protein
MDKIFLKDWMNSFSHVEQNIIQSTDRYMEIVISVEEPRLARSKSWMIKVPGMIGTFTTISPERGLHLCDTEENEYIQSAFILNGLADSRFNNRPVVTQANSHAFQYSSHLQADHKIANVGLEAFHISFEMDFFKKLIQTSDSREFENMCNNLEKKEQYLIPPSLLPLQVRMNEIIAAIKNCAFHSPARSLFMEAKMLELFALQLEQMNNVGRTQKETFSTADKEKLKAVKVYIETNYLRPLSLALLVSMFGLNEFKLKKGYKQLFNTTVFGHIYHLRMQKAVQLLSQKDRTVSEIADLVGYSNVGSFSSEFKKRFGYPPSKANCL